MADTQEQLVMRMGFDGREANRGLDAMRDRQKKDAMDYADFWKTALAKKDLAMEASAAKELATHKANQAVLLKLTEERLAKEAAINAGIAAGSIPANMAVGVAGAGGMVAGGYAFNAAGKILGKVGEDGKLVKEAEQLAEGAGKVAHELHGSTGALRELFVIVHEGISGRFKQMFGSMLRLVSLIGGSTIMMGTGLVAAGLAAVVGPSAWRYHKAAQGEEQSAKDLEKREKELPEILNRQAERKLEIEHEIARIHEQTRREQDEDRLKHLSPQQQANALGFERMDLLVRMRGMKKDTVEYAQAEQEIARLTLQITEKQAEAEKEKAEAGQKKKEHDRETLEINKQMVEEQKKARDVRDRINDIDVDRPTIAQLAGRGYTARLSRAYGAGGRYDLERGDGPFGQLAREAELAAKQQMWDVIHGNAQFDERGNLIGGAALDDRNRRVYAENQLSQAGIETPAMKATKMNEELIQINTGIAELNARAKGDGIVIKTSE